MEFVAVAKTGVHIYTAVPAESEGESKQSTGEPVVSLPPAGSAFGFAWSKDGSKLATVDQGRTVIWDAEDNYKQVLEIQAVGDSGGARALLFSPRSSFLLTFEKYDKEKCPENMHVWDLRRIPDVKKVRSLALRSYTSGAITADLIQWVPDESMCFELIVGEGIKILDEDLQACDNPRMIKEPNATQFSVAPAKVKDGYYVSVYYPEACNSWGAWDLTGHAGEVKIYHVTSSSIEKISFQALPRKLNSCEMQWSSDGTALLALASSDVDETGESYFGTTHLFWLRGDGKAQCRVTGPEDGLVQDWGWSPCANEFLIIVGMMPAATKLYDGKTGKLVKDGALGTSRRNTIRWNPFGRFFVVGGFGQLPGDLDFFDRSSGETLCSFRASLTVNCQWAPDGRHFLTCTTAPRMNEDNQISVWGYNAGNRLLKVDFKPAVDISGGGRKAADAGAMLWAASWRPDGKNAYTDRAASPPPKGVKRVKGLPAENQTASGGGAAWSAKGASKGGAGNAVAAMMRGELDAPPAGYAAPGAGDRGWTCAPVKTPQELLQEQKEWAKKKKEEEKQKKIEEEEAKKAAKQELRAGIKKIEENEKLLKTLKAQLAELDKLKDKEWDELTEEDEAELEGEVELRARIAELEKGK